MVSACSIMMLLYLHGIYCISHAVPVHVLQTCILHYAYFLFIAAVCEANWCTQAILCLASSTPSILSYL